MEFEDDYTVSPSYMKYLTHPFTQEMSMTSFPRDDEHVSTPLDIDRSMVGQTSSLVPTQLVKEGAYHYFPHFPHFDILVGLRVFTILHPRFYTHIRSSVLPHFDQPVGLRVFIVSYPFVPT